MKYLSNFITHTGIYGLIFLLLLSPLQALAFTAPVQEILITEIQTSYDSAGQEFIELYNLSDREINLSLEGWKLQQFTANSLAGMSFSWQTTKPSVTIVLTGTILPGSYYLLAATNYAPGGAEPDQVYSPRLSDEGGGLQLITANSATIRSIDQIAWHKEPPADNAVTLYEPAGKKQSLERMADEADSYIDELFGTPFPYLINTVPSPKGIWQNHEESPADTELDSVDEEPVPDVPPDESSEDEEPLPPPNGEIPDSAQAIQITEMLPNPAAPLTDGSDEYVELYNPNGFAVDISDYVLHTGINDTYKHVFIEGSEIAGMDYTVVTSGETSLSLSNTAGKARLFDPNGRVISESGSYASAPDGQAWALFAGVWQWTIQPTSAAANNVVQSTTAAKLATKSIIKPKAAPKPKTAAKPAAKKVKKAATKPAAKKATALKAAATTRPPEVQPVSQIHGLILASVGGLAVAYACYEYRADIGNQIYRLRNYRKRR